MYYFTEIDPDYKLIGSRDPLGFQSIWASSGRKLIAYLSTVSTSLVDFQILTYAKYWHDKYKKEDNSIGFIPFFLKLEQAFAYARIQIDQTGFNGITKVSERKDDNKFTLGVKSPHTILSNQRTYGIYGKYIRPFTSMKISEYPGFNDIIAEAINEKTSCEIEVIIKKISENDEPEINREQLELFSNLIKSLTEQERTLFTDKILKTDKYCDKPQNQDLFFDFLQEHSDEYLPKNEEKFHLYNFIDSIKEKVDPEIKAALEEIENTERIVSVCNYAFDKLLSKPSWTSKELKEEKEFWECIKPYKDSEDYEFSDGVISDLRNAISKSDIKMKVKALIERNIDAKGKNKRGWIEKKDDKLTVTYGQNNNFKEINTLENHSEINYFIDSYLNLYKKDFGGKMHKIEKVILLNKLKEVIAGRKIQAAVFYTFNFDVDIFENYILPIFLPDVPFTNNEIQNTILWRRFQKDLPPITVYYDYFAKDDKSMAPTLGYDTRYIALEKTFHPKISFILLEKSLVAITGSNNLTKGGWITNLEAFSITEFKNNEYYPKEIKDDYKKFMKFVLEKLVEKEHTKAELQIYNFFKQQLYTEPTQHQDNYISKDNSFWNKLDELTENGNNKFQSAEIISPYFSDGVENIEKLKKYIEGDIKIAIPYSATLTVSISKELFYDYKDAGVKWCGINVQKENTEFRFNHSKVFRFYGEDKVYTVIGSANFTTPALCGYNKNGNVEFSTIFTDDCAEELLSERKSFDDLHFEGNKDEKTRDARITPPQLYFTIDWRKILWK